MKIDTIRTTLKNRLKLLPYEYLKSQPRYQEKKIKLLDHEFKVADCLSFYYSYKEIFLGEIYKFETKKQAPVIVDCGSNYGTSIVYFKRLFPQAIITGVEADPYIYSLLNWNIQQRNYNQVSLLNNALSTSPEPIDFLQEGADGGRIATAGSSQKTVKVDTIGLDALLTEPVDFLKIDIEGAETAVITASEQLTNVSAMFIEYHSFKNAPQVLNQLLAKLSAENFRYYIHTQFCSPRPLIEEQLQLGMDLQLNIFAKKG